MSRMLVVICLALAMASTSYGVAIGNWDTELDGWKSGADAGWGNGGTLLMAAQPMTSGTGLAAVSSAGGFLWDTVGASWNAGAIAGGSVVGENTKFEFDVERTAENYAGAGWGNITVKIEIQYAADGGTTIGTQYNDVTSWYNAGTSMFDHVVIDYSSLVLVGEEIWNWQIAIASNTDVARATLYDNAQFTPEPATMALLGLGGLALIRRKK